MRKQVWLNLPVKLSGKQPIVLFDGKCTLCSKSVRFLIKHNKTGNLNFTSLQSGVGLEIILMAGMKFQQRDTLLLVEKNRLYGYSTAALKIAAYLSFPWRLLGILRFIPVVIRDRIYRFIAGKRYEWFGRETFCMTKGIQNRFLS